MRSIKKILLTDSEACYWGLIIRIKAPINIPYQQSQCIEFLEKDSVQKYVWSNKRHIRYSHRNSINPVLVSFRVTLFVTMREDMSGQGIPTWWISYVCSLVQCHKETKIIFRLAPIKVWHRRFWLVKSNAICSPQNVRAMFESSDVARGPLLQHNVVPLIDGNVTSRRLLLWHISFLEWYRYNGSLRIQIC